MCNDTKKINYNHLYNNAILQRRIISPKNFTYYYQLRLIEKYTRKERFEKILDVGCGVGTLDFYLAAMGVKVTGIDISAKAIKLCINNAIFLNVSKNTKFLAGNFLKVKIKDKYDAILCFEVLEHLDNDQNTLEKISNLLTNSGILFLSVPSKSTLLYKLQLLRKFDQKVGHLRRYSEKEIVSLIKKYLNIIEVHKIESPFRNILFVSNHLKFIVKFLNNFGLLSVLISKIDIFFCKLFGESNIILVAKKKS
ncbi:MAG: methyltransferase domain-containing protein [Nitrososphaeria archaeon]